MKILEPPIAVKITKMFEKRKNNCYVLSAGSIFCNDRRESSAF